MDALGLLGLGGTPAAAARRMALSQALLGLGAGMLDRGATAQPQSFASNLARGGAGFAAGLQNGIEDARRAGLLGLGAEDAQAQVPEPPAAANPARPPADGTAKAVPLPITDTNSVGVVKSIVATGQPLWLKTPDGRVDQVTPEEAKAWLQQHRLLK